LRRLRRFKVDEQRVSRRAKSGWRRVLRGLGLKLLAKTARARGVSVAPKHERYEPAKHCMRGPGPKARSAGTGADGGRTESTAHGAIIMIVTRQRRVVIVVANHTPRVHDGRGASARPARLVPTMRARRGPTLSR
jgi:hypothetical protein